jgi:competence protein ComEC
MAQKKIFLFKIIGAIFALILINFFIWFENNEKQNLLKVYFLDVGQGDAIFIETPNKTQVLIDAGENQKIIRELSEIMSFFDRTIDIIIATHGDSDHVGGFPEVIRRFEIKNYFDSGVENNNELNSEIKLLIQNEKNIKVQKIKRGDKITLDLENNINLEILWPPENYEIDDSNERSIVARLNYNQISFLLTGDAGIETEKKLIENLATATNILDVDILKAGHHGSKNSSGLEFLEKISPKITIISAGVDNKFGHPHQEVLDNLNKINSEIKNTAEDGRILIESDGENFWIKQENYLMMPDFFRVL